MFPSYLLSHKFPLSLIISAVGAEPTHWFSDVCSAVEMLGDFACGRTPLNLMMNEFKPQLRAAETVVLQVG